MCVCACALLVAGPAVAGAQTEATFLRPKLVTRGTNTTPLAGAGSVTVQVFVKKDGTSTVGKVIKSTNPGDDAAALEIAKTSKFAPATRGGVKVDAYYDFALNFNGDTAATGSGPLATALSQIRAGKYDDAKAGLQTYIQAHPSDQQAYTLLGVANAFGNDPTAAAAAFSKAGTVPEQYKALALQSYEKSADAALTAKRFSDAVTDANSAIALNPGSLEGYFVRGQAEIGAENYSAAIADLQKARSLAAAANADAKTQVTLAYALAVAQLDAGQFGEAATTARVVAQSDTARAAQLDKFAYAAAMNAAIPLANSGKIPEAVSRLESGAAAFPNIAADLTAEAAYIMATDKSANWDKVKAEAEKALALDPNSGRAEYVLGVAAANKKDAKGALDYMNKAKASPSYSSDPALAKQIDSALNQLNSAGKQ